MHLICRKPYLTAGLQKAFPEDAISETWDPQAEIVVAEPKELVPALLDQLPDLKLALCARAGYDTADIAYLKARGIMLCNAWGLYSIPIAEDIVCKLLIWSTNTWLYNQQKAHCIYQSTPERSCLTSMTIGFLGTGSIAQEAAIRLKAFGCRILGYKRTPCDPIKNFDSLFFGPSGLKSILSQSDAVVLAVNLNPETRHMVNAETIRWMKDGAAIINIARGSVVDEDALIQALRSGKLSYAGLDVFETEPLPPDSPLWTFPQVTLTPHASGLCRENHSRLEQMVIENLRRYQEGEALINRVL